MSGSASTNMRIVSCQLSVVSCQLVLIVCPSSRGWPRSDRLEVVIKLRAEFVDQGFEGFHIRVGQKVTAVGTSETMLRLVERATCCSNEPPVIGVAATPVAFGNIRADTIGSSDKWPPTVFLANGSQSRTRSQ